MVELVWAAYKVDVAYAVYNFVCKLLVLANLLLLEGNRAYIIFWGADG